MATNGIGSAVKRKEDLRFITGSGRYTDDIHVLHEAHACFVRSPHAHATIGSIDTSAASAMPGVLGVFKGEDVAADGLGGLICGWMVKSKDGSPMKAGPHPILAHGKARYVGDHVAVVVAETFQQARDAAEAVVVDYGPLPAAVDVAKSHNSGVQVHDDVPNNLVYDWEIGDKAATDAAFANAAHVTRVEIVNNRLIPNAMEPRAALGHYEAGTDSFTLYTTSQNPHVARLVISAFVGIAPEHKLTVVAPDVGGGFGSKIFIYAEECVALWASKKLRRPVKWNSDRTEAFLSDAHGRDHASVAEMAMDKDGHFLALRVNTKANMGAYLSTSACIPTYLYATLLAGHTRRRPCCWTSRPTTPTRPRWTLIVAPAGRKPPTSWRPWSRSAARTWGWTRRKSVGVTSFRSTPSPTRPERFSTTSATTRPAWTRRWSLRTTPASPRVVVRPSARASCAASVSPPTSKLAASSFGGGGSLGAGVGLWESAKVRFSHTGKVSNT